MKKFFACFAILLYWYIGILPRVAPAQEPPLEPTPRCVCSPGDIGYDCYKTIPDGWCDKKDAPGDAGRGQEKRCNDDCLGWTYTGNNVCTTYCKPPEPQITPIHESFENSIGAVNEGLEGGVLSGTRDVGIDPSQRDNYRAASALVPAGGPNHELRVKFIKSVKERQGDYKVYLADGTPKSVWAIWNECTENGHLDNWRAYQEKLENCPNWGFVPTAYRRLASEPTPAVKAKEIYFKDQESPLVLGWTALGIPLEWLLKFFQTLLCNIFGWLGWFCPADPSLPLKNPFDAPGWTKDKLNVPAEAEGNAQFLRRFLLPKDFPLGKLPKGNNTYFETEAQDLKLKKLLEQTLAETGRAAQLLSADGGLLPIFQPKEIKPKPPSSCDKDDEERFNPEKCASEYYFRLENASPGACGPGKICYSDTPDQKTFNYPARLVDDRSYTIQATWDFLQQSLWPGGVAKGAQYPSPKIPPGSGKLDFLIPYRDASIRVINPEAIKALVKSSWPAAKLDLWDLVVEKSVALRINPAFTLAIWIEESGAGGAEPPAWSDFGCFPGGDTNQRVPFNASLNCFLNFTTNEHPDNFEEWVRWFCGPKAEPICANNPGFISRLKWWYSQLVPPGNPGAIIPKPSP